LYTYPVVAVVTVTVVTVPEVVDVTLPLVVAVVTVPEVVAVVTVPEVVVVVTVPEVVAVVTVPEVVVVVTVPEVVEGFGEIVGELIEEVTPVEVVATPEEVVANTVVTEVVKEVGVYGIEVVTEVVVEVGTPLVAPVVAPMVVMLGITGLKEVTPAEIEGVPVPPVDKNGKPGQSLGLPAPQTCSPCTMVAVPPDEPVEAVRQIVTTLSVNALSATVPGSSGDDGGTAPAGICQVNTCICAGSKYWPFL